MYILLPVLCMWNCS